MGCGAERVHCRIPPALTGSGCFTVPPGDAAPVDGRPFSDHSTVARPYYGFRIVSRYNDSQLK